MRVAVVGHVEWVTFARAPAVPAAGEIVHATEVFEQPAGGGAVSALALRDITGDSALWTVLGDDPLGRAAAVALREAGVEVRAVHRGSTRRAVTHLDADGERTITVLGDRHEPRGSDPLGWDDLAGFDAAYVAGADPDAVARARAARVLVATARILPALRASGVHVDALVGSASDPAERYAPGDLAIEPSMVVRTDGRAGGTATTAAGTTRYAAAPEPEVIEDRYGCGDRFAIALTIALAAGSDDPLRVAAEHAAAALSVRGAGA